MPELTWQQRQRRALGLPFEGVQPATLIITLYDSGRPSIGAEQRAFGMSILDDRNSPEEVMHIYMARILELIAKEHMFDGLRDPVVLLKVVPGLSDEGQFPEGHTIYEREYNFNQQRFSVPNAPQDGGDFIQLPVN